MVYNSELLNRVKKGNDAVMAEWVKAQNEADNQQAWNKHMGRIDEAMERLNGLCQQLMIQGYSGCLYSDGSKKECDKPFICLVCPKKVI